MVGALRKTRGPVFHELAAARVAFIDNAKQTVACANVSLANFLRPVPRFLEKSANRYIGSLYFEWS
jgi:hypothetical protein